MQFLKRYTQVRDHLPRKLGKRATLHANLNAKQADAEKCTGVYGILNSTWHTCGMTNGPKDALP